METISKFLVDIEVHNVQGIRDAFAGGLNPNSMHDGMPLVDVLISFYTRTPRFSDCFRAFLDAGLIFEDRLLKSVLLNDSVMLERELSTDPLLVKKLYSLPCTYTPMFQVTLMHVCAEFNHVDCAKILNGYGADINARAGLDENGFGGQTPVFHTVNQNNNNSAGMLQFLLKQGADLHHTVTGIVWGKGFEWETFIPSVNPLSYAIMGLLPQMHRREEVVAETVGLLMKYAYGIDYTPQNVPCRYLQ